MKTFKEMLVKESANLKPISNKGLTVKIHDEAMQNVLMDILKAEFGDVFIASSTGITPNGKFFQIDVKKGKENLINAMSEFIQEDKRFVKAAKGTVNESTDLMVYVSADGMKINNPVIVQEKGKKPLDISKEKSKNGASDDDADEAERWAEALYTDLKKKFTELTKKYQDDAEKLWNKTQEDLNKLSKTK